MYSVEFRIVSTPAEMIPARQTEMIQKVNKVGNALDSPHHDANAKTAPDKKDTPAEREQREQLQEVLKKTTGAGRYLRFDKHEQTGKWIVRVCDSRTDAVVKEIPPEKILDVVSRICELAGLLVDENV